MNKKYSFRFTFLFFFTLLFLVPEITVDASSSTDTLGASTYSKIKNHYIFKGWKFKAGDDSSWSCLLYTSDAADERSSVDLGGRRIIKKKNKNKKKKKKKELTQVTTNKQRYK